MNQLYFLDFLFFINGYDLLLINTNILFYFFLFMLMLVQSHLTIAVNLPILPEAIHRTFIIIAIFGLTYLFINLPQKPYCSNMFHTLEIFNIYFLNLF